MAYHAKIICSSMMKQLWIIVISCLTCGKISASRDVNLRFPKNFKLGAGSSAYQIEGAWNVSDKGESNWDRWLHDNPDVITDGNNGDVANNAYYKYREDVQLFKSLGLNFYRFSIAWSRVLPTGFTNAISKDGLQYYKNLVAELVTNGIEPIVTLWHLDHPQVLEEYGGWTNELMVDWFVSYARIMFEALGDSVKIWTTFNEPGLFCPTAYDTGELAPGKLLNRTGGYHCVHNVLKAHAKTYHMYNEKFRATQQGEIGIVEQCTEYVAKNSSDTESAETAFQFQCGWIFHPIFKGDYPEIMKTRIAMISAAQGYEKSRLPEFSEEWISVIKGTVDFLGLNHYLSVLVAPDPDEKLGIYNSDNGLVESVDPSWLTTVLPGISLNPAGFGDILRQIRDEYNNPPVRVMENGYFDRGGLEDYDRIRFHYDCLTELLTAVKQDDCNVKSYSIWSLMDDFEWTSGYTLKFGIIDVDFNNTDRTRTPKLSASWWKSVLESRELRPVPTRSDL